MFTKQWTPNHKYPETLTLSERLSIQKATLVQSLSVPAVWGSHISKQSAHKSGNVVSTRHWPSLPTRKYSCYTFLLEDEFPQGQIVAGRNLTMRHLLNNTVKIRTRNLPSCSAVPQPTTPPRVSSPTPTVLKFKQMVQSLHIAAFH